MASWFWSEDRAPSLKEYPFVLLRAASGGALLGTVFSFATTAVFARPLTHAFDQWPKILLYSAYTGAVFTLSFFVCCALPWSYIRPLMTQYPPRAKWVITAIIGSLGAMLAFAIAIGLIGFIPEIHF